jgi:O-acetyl-ADP-ribose deacetylase (regulator of RNase III)
MIEIRRADITTLHVDAIVNAANTRLARGGGVCGAIHAAAGPALEHMTREMPPCPTGDAVLTPGFELPARFIIHAVGPVWSGGDAGEAELLRAAYESSFRVAREEGTIRSIAFPAISTGIYGFPKQRAAEIAVAAMREHEQELERIIACLFDDESVSLYEAELQRVARP